MDYDKVEDIFYEIQDSLGLSGYIFQWSWARGIMGKIDLKANVVYLSEAFVADNDEESVRQVVLHEFAHAIDYKTRGHSNHDRVFNSICSHIGCYESDDVRSRVYVEPRYVFFCQCCERIVGGVNKLPWELKQSMKCPVFCRNNLFDTPLLREAIIVKADDECQLGAPMFEEYKSTVLSIKAVTRHRRQGHLFGAFSNRATDEGAQSKRNSKIIYYPPLYFGE